MIIKIKDKEIDTEKVYKDTINNVKDIHIEQNNVRMWCALPNGLDMELIEDVIDGLELQ